MYGIFTIEILIVVTLVISISDTQGLIFLDSSVEDGYEHSDQLHKRGDSENYNHEYQSLEMEKSNDDEFSELLQKIAQQPHVKKRSSYKDNERDIGNNYGRYRYINNNKVLPWRPYLYVKPSWLESISIPRKFNHQSEEGLITNNNVDRDLGKFSKIYLLLDPEANITQLDVKEISKMVSSLLLPGRQKKPTQKLDIQKLNNYKGFLMRDRRRRMRESKELFAAKDSVEHDYKPKRGRGEYVGGGRTAIPYIRQRGDIFERD